MTRRSGSMFRMFVLALASLSIGAHALSISGTVKTSTGTVLSGVTVTVKDSAKYITTTGANGEFSFQSAVGVAPRGPRSDAFSAHLLGHVLTVRSPVEGNLQLALVDASGQSIWSAEALASNGIASATLPSGLRSGAVFLRIRHAGGTSYQAVSIGSGGLQIAPQQAAARASATYPTLLFKKTGYNDTSYTMTSETAAGITVTMTVPTVCDLPTTFKWKDYGKPVASPKNGWVSIKDFTHVLYNGMHYVHMTYYTTGWNAATMAPFANWADADAAKQTASNTGVAPELMYFTPKKTWINSKQWCSGGSFCWMEASDVSKPSTFALKGNLLTETITVDKAAPIDQTLICDDNSCYIFYADDNGRIYRGSMPKANFPGTFTGTKMILEDTKTKLFEAVQVYKLKGQKKYLMIVECAWTRYFRAFTATDLGGDWTPLGNTREEATPFAGAKNVTGGWSNDISHGDLIRSSYDEYREIDPCNLQLLYQGYKSPFTGDYGLIPYQMGLLTLQK